MRSVRTFALLALVAAALTACGTVNTGSDATVLPQATFGGPDGGAHPYVVTLLFHQVDGWYSCSGTLLSPTVVLTAGHCTESAGKSNSATYVTNEEVVDTTGLHAVLHPGEGIDTEPLVKQWAADHGWVAGDAIPHPQYADYAEFPQTYDVGVVLLDDPIVLDEYGTLPEIGTLADMLSGKHHRDRRFTVVGYGMQGYIPAFYRDDWQRETSQSTLININSLWSGDEQSAGFTNNPGKGNGSGGTCYGDSGGPLFVGDTNVVGAVVSYGFTPCIGIDYNFRMDTVTAQDFVTPFLDN